MTQEQDLIKAFQRVEMRRAGISLSDAHEEQARQHIIAQWKGSRHAPDVQEFHCPMKNEWEQLLFHGLLKRYGIRPYRYRKQRNSTIMIRVSKRFLHECLWPMFNELSLDLQQRFNAIVKTLLPAVAASPYDIAIIDHDHGSGDLCADCRKRLFDEVG